ncbi:hypothetical protein SAICODRAFT_69658 [Saitoella complicata NRRL Y-17804]|nr:uncharacterized protein SAICODRAFT_69658 [Saitoella complicata NRRL Y-17804]ODQ55024.1 hypothetical protein SAICODRAFT_69658 [Saitoella complicata NRRL Y-17804]
MRYITLFTSVAVSSFTAGTVVAASVLHPAALNVTGPYQFANTSAALVGAGDVGQDMVASSHVAGPDGGFAIASETPVPVVIYEAEAEDFYISVTDVSPVQQATSANTCPAPTFTYGQVVTNPAQTITSATTTHLLASSTCLAGTLTYYIQTSSAVAALPYSELTAATHTLTVTEFIDERVVATGVWEVSPSTVTVVKTVEGTGVFEMGKGKTYTMSESGEVAYCSESTVEITETVKPTKTVTITSWVTISSSVPSQSWAWFESDEVEALCASLVGTATRDVTMTSTSTTFVQNFVTSTYDLFNTTTYPVALNKTAIAFFTSTNVVPAYATVNTSSVYNISVPSTAQTSTTSTLIDVSDVTETPYTTTTEAVPTTSTTVTTSAVTSTSTTFVYLPKRANGVVGAFDAALEENENRVVEMCLAKFGRSTVTLSHAATEVQSVLEKNGTVISTRTSVISAPVLVPTVITTTTLPITEQVTSTSTVTDVIAVPSTVTYIDGTSTLISVTTVSSTMTLTAPAIVVTESTPTVVGTQTQTVTTTTTVVFATCAAPGQPCDLYNPGACCNLICFRQGLNSFCG